MFEAIGISESVINEYFRGTVTRVGGISLEDIGKNIEAQHSRAFDPVGLDTNLELEAIGRHKARSQGENHRYNPQTIHMLQTATREGDYKKFKQYTEMVNSEKTGYCGLWIAKKRYYLLLDDMEGFRY